MHDNPSLSLHHAVCTARCDIACSDWSDGMIGELYHMPSQRYAYHKTGVVRHHEWVCVY